jgi:hypothetical protein
MASCAGISSNSRWRRMMRLRYHRCAGSFTCVH